jgi:hypothetical protein
VYGFMCSFMLMRFICFVQSPRQQQANVVPKPRSQTLDSLFANMKEQRMRILSRHNNAPLPRNALLPRNGGGSRIPPWARGRMGN